LAIGLPVAENVVVALAENVMYAMLRKQGVAEQKTRSVMRRCTMAPALSTDWSPRLRLPSCAAKSSLRSSRRYITLANCAAALPSVNDVLDVGYVIPRPIKRILEPTTNDGAGNLLCKGDRIGTVNYVSGEAQIDAVHYNSTGRIR
jgi:hypothetical protein